MQKKFSSQKTRQGTPFTEHFSLKKTKFNAAESGARLASQQQEGFYSAFPSSNFADIIYERLPNRAMLVVKPAVQAQARDTMQCFI